MNKEKQFGDIYDCMSYNNGRIDELISNLYEYLKENPSNEVVLNTLSKLESIALDMVYSQKQFVETYAEPKIKDSLVSSIDSREQNIKKFYEDIKEKTL